MNTLAQTGASHPCTPTHPAQETLISGLEKPDSHRVSPLHDGPRPNRQERCLQPDALRPQVPQLGLTDEDLSESPAPQPKRGC